MGPLEPIALSFGVVDLVVLFIFKYLQSVEMTKPNVNKCQISGPYKEANMQMSGRKAEKALSLPKPQRYLHPRKGTSFT